MNVREADRYLQALAEVRASGGRAAVATIVRVRGSAYRREGTRMLVRPDGTYECALSGGCLEPAVADAATRVLATGTPALIAYDLADDSVWGLNIGCSGAVDIRIERIEDDPVTLAWHEALREGQAAVLVTPLTGDAGRRLLRRTGDPIGSLGVPALDAAADAIGRARLSSRGGRAAVTVVDGIELFADVNLTPTPLVIFGAGYDAVPLARQAWALGFAVTVVDPRQAYLRPDLFTGARLVLSSSDDAATAAACGPETFAVVMHHHVERDRLALRTCLDAGVAYVGVLGPRARYERLRADLSAAGWQAPPAARTRVHSPAGLALGGETPEEVALSILAEMVAVREGFAGGFLNGTSASLHAPAAGARP
ncbi:MAG: XdhC family protein [Vicinamibacterales bacterium]